MARRAARNGGKRRRSARAIRSAIPRTRIGHDDHETGEVLRERRLHFESTPSLSGGDLDADWQHALSTGEEAVGGSVATPDQDIVDELGRALGVEQALDDEVHTSAEILRARDRHYWHLERIAAGRERG